MAQTIIEVTATNGSPTVTLASTTGIVVGSYFKRSNEGVAGAYTTYYEVASFVTDTSVTLSANYAGTTGTFNGIFVSDFTTNYSMPLMYTGDLDIPDVLRRGFNIIDANMAGLNTAVAFAAMTNTDDIAVNKTTNANTTIGSNNQSSGTSAKSRFLATVDGGSVEYAATSSTYADITGAADCALINANSLSGGVQFAIDGVTKAKVVDNQFMIQSGGVDAAPADCISSYYSGNNNEQNAIQASVSSNGLLSGWRLLASDGGGASTQKKTLDSFRDKTTIYANDAEIVGVTASGMSLNGNLITQTGATDFFGAAPVNPHQAGNVGSVGLGITDGGGVAGVFVENTHDGTYSSQHIDFKTAEGGISAATTRMTINKNGRIDVPIGISFNAGTDTLSAYTDWASFNGELWDDSLVDESASYTNRVGYWRRVGNKVEFYINMHVSSLGTLTTTEGAKIGNMPVAAARYSPLDVGYSNGINLGAAYGLLAYMEPGTSYLNLGYRNTTGNSVLMSLAEFSADGDIYISGSYEV